MNATFRAGWLTAALFSAATLLPAQTSVQEDLLRADKQFDLYAYNLALRTYESVLKAEPNNAHALARTGDCYFQLNRPEDALSWYDRAVTQPSVEPEALLHYGKALMQTGDYVGAKKWFLFYAEGDQTVGKHFAEMCDYARTAAGKEGIYQVRNEPLNTDAADYAPAFYGNRVVFNSARTDIKRKTQAKSAEDWTGSAYNQLFVSQQDPENDYLSRPAFLRSDLQNTFNEGPVSFTADGKRVAFCRNNFIDGTRQIADKGINMSLYIADVVDGNWVNIKPFPYNGSDYATGFPCFTPDGSALYFATNSPNGNGGWDVYLSNWTGANWSLPRNLGAPLNTPGNEVTPFTDGKNLYFSSDWHKGFGGLDVFRAEMQGFDNVLNIFHLGPGVNSARDDYGFIFNSSENIGYVASNRPEGRGREDIWQLRKRVNEFVISVVDIQENPVAAAEIDFSACGGGVKKTDYSGRYAFAVSNGNADCRATVRKKGYISTMVGIKSGGSQRITAVLLPESAQTTDIYADQNISYTPPATTTATRSTSLPTTATTTPSTGDNLDLGSLELLAAHKTPKETAPATYVYNESADPTYKGYSIQLAASPEKYTESRLYKYNDLTDHGNLYTKPEGKLYKLRLGVYPTKAAADKVYDKIKKTHKGAFVVEEKEAEERFLLRDEASTPAEYSYASKGLSTKSTPVTYSALPTTTADNAPVHFSVQVASLTNKSTIELNRYADLADIGKLYIKPDANGAMKVRVGPWQTYDEAETALGQITRLGYSDAIVVAEKTTPGASSTITPKGLTSGADNYTAPATYSTTTAKTKKMNAESAKAKEPVPDKSAPMAPITYSTPASKLSAEPGNFYVRICSLTGDPRTFDTRRAEMAGGKVETRKSPSGATIMLLGGFSDLDDAVRANGKLVELGFTDAYVVKETEDAKLRRIQF